MNIPYVSTTLQRRHQISRQAVPARCTVPDSGPRMGFGVKGGAATRLASRTHAYNLQPLHARAHVCRPPRVRNERENKVSPPDCVTTASASGPGRLKMPGGTGCGGRTELALLPGVR